MRSLWETGARNCSSGPFMQRLLLLRAIGFSSKKCTCINRLTDVHLGNAAIQWIFHLVLRLTRGEEISPQKIKSSLSPANFRVNQRVQVDPLYFSGVLRSAVIRTIIAGFDWKQSQATDASRGGTALRNQERSHSYTHFFWIKHLFSRHCMLIRCGDEVNSRYFTP